MGISLDEYKNNRAILINELENYGRLLEEMGLREDKRKVLQYIQDILEDSFQVVVVGEFSRGKSTFINALLGSRILPSSAKPTTTILNKITYSARPVIKLHFHDENLLPETISEESFKALVAPMDPIVGDSKSEKEYEKQVGYVKKIKYAEIGRDLAICENGVEIIDTPGTNDLDPLREEITNTIIPRSDAAILLLSAVKILSVSELSLLRDRLLANDIQKIFIVVNFKDELKTVEDERKVIEFAYTNLKGILPNPKIYMVSAKHALNARRLANGEELKGRRGMPLQVWNFEQTGFPELEEHLADFLQYERGSIKLMKPLKRTLGNMKEVKKKHISLEQEVLKSQVKGLKDKVNAFKPKVNQAKKNAQESEKILKNQLQFEEKKLYQWYEKELGEITNKALNTFDAKRHLSVADIGREIDLAVAGVERKVFEKKKEQMNNIAKKSISTASAKINSEWSDMEIELDNLTQTNYPLSTEFNGARQTDGVGDFFESIYEELDDAWNSSTGFWAKAGVGTGIAISAVAHGIVKLFSWGWSKINGIDEKSQLRSNLFIHYNELADKKLIVIKSEYRNMSKSVEEQYKEVVKQHLSMVNRQLDQLIKTTSLEGEEITVRENLLLTREAALNSSMRKIEQLAAKLRRESAGKVEV